MWRTILMSAPCFLVAACSSTEDRARAVLSKAERHCGLSQGTIKFMGVNHVYDEQARKPSGQKIIVVSSPDLGRRQRCVDDVAQSGGFERVMRFVYDGTDPG